MINIHKGSKTWIIIINFILAYSTTYAVTNADSNIVEEISLWRNDIVSDKYPLDNTGFRSEYSAKLAKRGANVLPYFFEAYKIETDPNVLWRYQGLIQSCSRFEFFNYSRKALVLRGMDLQCLDQNDLPFLSLELGANKRPVQPFFERTIFQRDKLVQWWSEHNTFTKRNDVIDKIRTATGRTKEQFLSLTENQARQFDKLKVFGIYNIPYYIDAIEQDNNPVALVEFLRIGGSPEYQRLFNLPYDLSEFSRMADNAYPSKFQKKSLICLWWTENKDKYAKLEDLYAEIEKRMAFICDSNFLDK